MRNPIHRLIGFVLSRRCVYTRLEAIAMRDPDAPILSPDGTQVYMHRGWLFNKITDYKRKYPWFDFSIRVHRIMMHDLDRDKHDHPWAARTFIMHNGYDEERLHQVRRIDYQGEYVNNYHRMAGDTSTLGYKQYHKITRLHDPAEGALTLFIFGKFLGDWGFIVNGEKIKRRDYEVMMGKRAAPPPNPPFDCGAMCTSGQWHCPCGAAWDNGDERPGCRPGAKMTRS